MATTTFCDWCGELMEVPGGEKPAQLLLSGNGGTGSRFRDFIWHNVGGGFNVHAERAHDRGVHPDCCLGQLETMLAERASWAHDPDQEDLEWRLVPREGRTLTARQKAIRAEEAEREEMDRRLQERDAEWAAWKQLPADERVDIAVELLRQEPATITELAERMQDRLPGVRVYSERLRPLIKRLFEDGRLDREGEQWRAGTGPGSTRYRYSVKAEVA